MAVVVVATWTARPGSGTQVRDALVALAQHSREEPGCRSYQPYVDPERPETFHITEVYDDEAAFEAHLTSEHFQRLAAATALPLLSDRQRASYQSLG